MEEEQRVYTSKTEQSEPDNPKKGESSFLGEVVRFAVIAVLIVLPIRLYIAQPFIVSGASMVPSFTNGDYLIVDEISYRFEEPSRGDVIIFRYPLDPSKFFIKRVIALPNETLSMRDGIVSITTADGEALSFDEPYSKDGVADVLEPLSLGEDEYFVMGDNRRQSADSRIWGMLPKENIVGKALLRLFPISKADFYPGAIEN